MTQRMQGRWEQPRNPPRAPGSGAQREADTVILPIHSANIDEPMKKAFDARSLCFDRFISPQSKDEKRRDEITRTLSLKPKSDFLRRFPSVLPGQTDYLYLRTEARLLINMAGGVLENAGLSLHRFSGVPFIPGSAIKGCARRAAIASIRDEGSTEKKAQLLADAAIVFGWIADDWKPGRKESDNPDLVWSLGPDLQVLKQCREYLDTKLQEMGVDTSKGLPKQFQGTVVFFDAFPHSDEFPTDGSDLELDVLTVHHPEYYSSKEKTIATDDEGPNPVVFPAVKSGLVFGFGLYPLRQVPNSDLLARAKTWLTLGLTHFGLGAKTAAGYGWFTDMTDIVASKEEAKKQRALQELQEKEAVAKREKEKADALSRLSPADRYAQEYVKMEAEAFAKLASELNNLDSDHQVGFLKALSTDKREALKGWRKKAEKGDEKPKARLKLIEDVAKKQNFKLS